MLFVNKLQSITRRTSNRALFQPISTDCILQKKYINVNLLILITSVTVADQVLLGLCYWLSVNYRDTTRKIN